MKQSERHFWFKLLLISFLCASFPSFVPKVHGQNPGGISAVNASLGHWFNAGGSLCGGACANGGTLTTIDAIDGVDPTASATGCTYITGALNFNPVVRLATGEIGVVRDAVVAGDLTAFVVYSTTSTATNAGNWIARPFLFGGNKNAGGSAGKEDFGMVMNNGTLHFAHDNNADGIIYNSPAVLNTGEPFIVSARRDREPGGGVLDMFLNGFNGGAPLSPPGNDPITVTDLYVSHNGLDGGPYLDGDLAEIILYGTLLTALERERVESYLGLKYGLTLGHPYRSAASGATVYSSLGGFDKNIIGVAAASSSLLDQKISVSPTNPGLVLMNGAQTSTGIAPFFSFLNDISYPTAMVDNTYQIMGDDNGSPTFNRNLGGGTANQLGRTWKVTDIGGVGPVTLWFKGSTFSQLTNGQNYYLSYGKNAGQGIGETFVPLVSVGGASNDFYVQIDFPNNDTTFFTLTRTNTFQAPGNVQAGLELWLMPDSMAPNAATTMTAWRDLSGNGHHIIPVSLAGSYTAAPAHINFHRILNGGALDRSWRTVQSFSGQTIAAVGRVTGGVATSGWMGFDNDVGFRASAATTLGNTVPASDFAAGGVLRKDGIANATPSLLDPALIYGERTAPSTRNRFYLGGFVNTLRFSTYDFGEMVIYSRALTAFERDRLESYLALKSGISLNHNYYASNYLTGVEAPIYTILGYANDVAGIGYDANSAFQQHQSLSANKPAVVSISLDPIKTYDSLNTATFGGDMSYLIAGHDNAAGACFTSDEINVAGQTGEHVRIQREWKLQKTGTWTASQVIHFGLETADVDFDLPALPPGTTTYYMYVSPSANLGGPGTIAYPASSVSGTNYNFVIPSDQLPTTGFFTFGTRFTGATSQTVCEGAGRVVIQRSHIADNAFCTYLGLDDGFGGVFGFEVGGTNTDSTFTVVNNALGTSCLDSLILILPPIVTAGTYTVFLDTVAGAPPCNLAAHTIFNNNADAYIDQLNVVNSDSAAITYTPGDTVYCVGENNVSCVIGGSIGTFKLVNSTNGTITNINQLVAGASTGTLLVHAGTTGTHHIRFVTVGPACKDSMDYTYTINPSASSTVTYAGSPFCGGNTATINPAPAPVANSGYSAVPALSAAALNPSTGALNLPSILNPGNYVITYDPDTLGCSSPSTTTITVNAATRCTFNYLDSVFCQGTGIIGPFVVNRPATGFWDVTPFSPMPIDSIDLTPSNGFIDLDSTAPGVYHIVYTVNGPPMSCEFNDTVVITVNPAPVSTFTMPAPNFDTLCAGAPAVTAIPTVPGGVFRSWDGYLNVAGNNISANPSFVGGPFTLYYVNTLGGCKDSTSRQISVRGQQVADIEYGAQQYCKNEADPLPSFISGTAGGTFSSQAGLSINAITGRIDLSASIANTYRIVYKTPDFSCPSFINVDTIVVDSVYPATFDIGVDSICSNAMSATFTGLPIGTGNHYTMWSGIDSIPFAVQGGNSPFLRDSLPPGGPYPVQNIRTVGLCSDTAFDFIFIIRKDSASIDFDPPVICVGDFNPYPVILGDGGGIFSSLSGHVVNDSTGIVQAGTVVDTVIIRYDTQGNCPSFDIDTLYVQLEINPQFNFTQVEYCTSDTGAYFPTIMNPGFGAFISTPAGLSIDPNTGELTPGSSVEETYNVRYVISNSGSCAADYEQTISVFEPDTVTTFEISADSALFVDQDTFCPSDLFAFAHVIGDSTGIFSADPGLIFANADNGTISLMNSIDTRTYTVTYSIVNVCDDRWTDEIVILTPDDASFAYDETKYCLGEGVVLPTANDSTGTYSISPAGLLLFDTQTGALDLSSNPTGNGAFVVTYQTNGTCTSTSTFVIQVAPRPVGIGLQILPQDVVCVGDDIRLDASGDASEFYYYRGTDTIPVGTGISHTFTDIVGTEQIRIRYVAGQGGCELDTIVTLTANPNPVDSVLYVPTIIESTVPTRITMRALTDSTNFVWSIVDEVGDITFESRADQTIIIDSSDTVDIAQVITLNSTKDPAQFTYLVTPWSRGCNGTERRITIKINPFEQTVFVPQVITPDGNGKNETWFIQLKDGIREEDYTIKLYNEAGALVYTMNPLVSSWDGGALPDGVYWYILYNDVTGEVVEAAGLTIRRNRRD